MGSIPESGRSPREGNGNPLQHSCMGNPADRGAWRAWKRARHKLATKQQWQQRPIFATIFLQVRVNSQFVHVCVGKSGMEDSAFS